MPDKSKKTVKSNTRNNDRTFCGEFLEHALYLHERATISAKRVSLVSAKRFVFEPFSCKEWRDKFANWRLLTKEGAELMRFLVQLFSVKPFKCCVLGQTNP